MPLAENYARRMWDKLSALATWQPDVPLAVGDVVSAGAGGVVTRETTLLKLGVSAERLPHSRHVAAPLREYDGVTVSASGSVTATSAAKARVSFSKKSSFLLLTDEGWQDQTDNMADARAIVENLDARGKWQRGWHLVTSVRYYPACTVVIARSSGVAGEVNVDPSAVGIGLDGIQAGVTVSVNSDQASCWAMSHESTPIYQAIGMKRRGRFDFVQRYQTMPRDPAGASDTEFVWTAQPSSPGDLGLL